MVNRSFVKRKVMHRNPQKHLILKVLWLFFLAAQFGRNTKGKL